MVQAPEKEIPYCTICLVFSTILCHVVVLTGNLATAATMNTLGHSTSGWSDVGVGLSKSLTDELDVIMNNVTQVLTVSIHQIQKAENVLDQVLNATGAVADDVVDKYHGQQKAGLLQMPTLMPHFDGPVAKPARNASKATLASRPAAKSKLPIGVEVQRGGRASWSPSLDDSGGDVGGALQEEEIISMMQTPIAQVPVMIGHSTKTHYVGHTIMPVLFPQERLVQLGDAVWAESCSNMHNMDLSDQGPDVSSIIGSIDIPKQLPTTPAGLQKFKASVKQSVEKVVKQMVGLVEKYMKEFLTLIKPALLQIGKWLNSFSDKIQSMLESFSTTLDRVQKIFDQLMGSMSTSKGEGEDQMLYDTFTLFDASNTGYISAQDLRDVAQMYGITALQGSKSDQLFQKYDLNHDGKLFRAEFKLFVNDETIPSVMAVVLRTFAKKLSVIAGNVGAARLRDEVALAVCDYFTLICAKNMTKVGWVSETLTNASVPIAFTADVFKQLALNVDDPNKLTTADVGAIVIGEMTSLNAPYVMKAFKTMSDPQFWVSEGFDPDDQPLVVQRVTKWILESKNPQVKGSFQKLLGSSSTVQVGSSRVSEDALAAEARNQAQQRMATFQQHQRKLAANEASQVAVSGASKHLQAHLLGGQSASTAGKDPAQAQSMNKGKPAHPSTLQFAKRLASNASGTADRFQHQCFNYSSESSTQLDNFADQVQAMIKKTQNFLRMMTDYSTPVGIKRLEDTIYNFADKATKDVANTLTQYMDHAIDQIAAQAKQGMSAGGSLMEVPRQPAPAPSGLQGIFGEIQQLLSALQEALPTVIDDLKYARKEVSAVSSTLKSTFSTFKKSGPPIFDKIGLLYRTAWVVYFILFGVLTLGCLAYGFWASGYMGGPKAAVAEEYEGPRTWRERCRVCCNSCSACMKGCHDSNLCFWSVILLLQILILILFLVSIVLCLLAGVKAFLSLGCAQIYLLNDEPICTGMLTAIRKFVVSFWSEADTLLPDACSQKTLLTCELIGRKLKSSAMKTSIGSVLAAVLSFQLIIESAILHERARWRRIFDEEVKEV